MNGEEVDSAKGGNYVQIEDGVYLIEAQEEYISIDVQPREELHYDEKNKQQGGGAS